MPGRTAAGGRRTATAGMVTGSADASAARVRRRTGSCTMARTTTSRTRRPDLEVAGQWSGRSSRPMPRCWPVGARWSRSRPVAAASGPSGSSLVAGRASDPQIDIRRRRRGARAARADQVPAGGIPAPAAVGRGSPGLCPAGRQGRGPRPAPGRRARAARMTIVGTTGNRIELAGVAHRLGVGPGSGRSRGKCRPRGPLPGIEETTSWMRRPDPSRSDARSRP